MTLTKTPATDSAAKTKTQRSAMTSFLVNLCNLNPPTKHSAIYAPRQPTVNIFATLLLLHML